MRFLAFFLVLLVAGLRAPAQDFSISLIDGTKMHGRLIALSGGDAKLIVKSDTEQTTLALETVLGIHGKAPRREATNSFHLVGGEQLRGEIRGGDPRGDTLTIASRSLGERVLAVDRLRAIVFASHAHELEPEDLQVPEGIAADEALFKKARRGLDTILGSIDRFARGGVVFTTAEGGTAKEFAYDTLLGLALRRGQPRKGTFRALLLTRSGDLIGVDLLGIEGEQLRVLCEGNQQIVVPFNEIAAVTMLGTDRRFLSDLVPSKIEEQS